MTEWVISNHFEQIMESLASGVLAIDAGGQILTVNRAACLHLGLAEDALSAGTALSVSSIPEAFRASLLEVFQRREPEVRREIVLAQPDGTRKEIGFTASLLKTPEEFGGMVFLFVDMTERRALERAAELNRQLAQIGELTAAVVHELRNPLAVIRGNTELLQRKITTGRPERRNLDAIYEETKTLERLVAQFLGFAKPFELDRALVSAQEVAARTVTACQPNAGRKSVVLHACTAGGDVRFSADAHRLFQALANIVNNAIDAVPPGGEVWVSTSRENGDAVFEVLDNGPGIHLQPGEDIFEPFFSRKENGTGLGLAICHRIVTAHKGVVTFGNRSEGGAWFVVRIPLEID